MPALSVETTTVTIGGHQFVGLSEDADAIMVPADFEFFTIRRGALGDMVALRNGAKGGPLELKLLPSSPSVKYWMRQQAAILEGSFALYQGTIYDRAMNASVRLRNGVLQKGPLGHTYGQGDVANRIFVFEFERFVLEYDNARVGHSIGA